MRIIFSLLLILLLHKPAHSSPEESSDSSPGASQKSTGANPSGPGPAQQPKPGPGAQPKPGPGAQPKPAPAPQPNPGPGAQPKPGPAPQPKPGPGAQPKPAPAPQPKPGQSQNRATGEWLSEECVAQKYTDVSCAKVFCPPWRRCISGKCVCKLPYQCPRLGQAVCGLDHKPYISFCQAQATACRTNTPVFSHYGNDCDEVFQVNIKKSHKKDVIQIETVKGKALICGKTWDMAAANTVCRHLNKEHRGAASAPRMLYRDLEGVYRDPDWSGVCMSVRCSGSELSLAECVIYEPQTPQNDTEVAVLNCYRKPEGQEKCAEFSCVNEKCVQWRHTCDGVNHCGDNSDEMCCKRCHKSFHCKSGVCIPNHAVRDGIRDCLGGEDELPAEPEPVHTSPPAVEKTVKVTGSDSAVQPEKEVTEPEPPAVPEPEGTDSDAEVEQSKGGDSAAVPEKQTAWSNPKDDILQARRHTESQLECGIPNMDYVYRTEDTSPKPSRHKRVVGGEEALPTQIQWQVAVQEEGKIHCGGAYLGGCWVLTAAHCVRAKPQAFRIKFSLWKKLSKQDTTDSVPVKNIIIHKDYNPRTYENDIALVQLEELAQVRECLTPNPAVRPVCVPWSSLQFQHGDTCTISGWGRNREGGPTDALKWANVTIIRNCKEFYQDKLFAGMECAGDLEGKVDSCQGDSGGPLVCKDAGGLSYVWGIVSWGEKCGEVNYPGVYTKVADYFEWIRFHTGWPAVTKYNH